MTAVLAFGDRYSNTTIQYFDTDRNNDQEDDISDGEYSDHDEQLDHDHSLVSYDSDEQGVVGEHEPDEEPNVDGDGIEIQENIFGNTATLAYSSDAVAKQVETIAINEQMPQVFLLEIVLW